MSDILSYIYFLKKLEGILDQIDLPDEPAINALGLVRTEIDRYESLIGSFEDYYKQNQKG